MPENIQYDWSQLHNQLKQAWLNKAVTAGASPEEVKPLLDQTVGTPYERAVRHANFVKKYGDIFLTKAEQEAVTGPEGYAYFHSNKDLGNTKTGLDKSGENFGEYHLSAKPKVITKAKEEATPEYSTEELGISSADLTDAPDQQKFWSGSASNKVWGNTEKMDKADFAKAMQAIKEGKKTGIKSLDASGIYYDANNQKFYRKIVKTPDSVTKTTVVPGKEAVVQTVKTTPDVSMAEEPAVEREEELRTESIMEGTEAPAQPAPTKPDYQKDWKEFLPVEPYKNKLTV
jgi:hypothetical protein